MKLQFIKASEYHNMRTDYDKCHISKTGQFRFRHSQSKFLSITEGMHVVPALDEDEKRKKTIWFFEINGQEGYNIHLTKNGYYMMIRSILVMAGIVPPVTCRISKASEKIEGKEYKGFKLIFDV